MLWFEQHKQNKSSFLILQAPSIFLKKTQYGLDLFFVSISRGRLRSGPRGRHRLESEATFCNTLIPNRHWKDSGRRLLGNNKNGHCGYISLMQLRAINEGFAPHLVEHAFLNARPELLAKLIDAARGLATEMLLASGDTFMLDGPQVATTERQIRALALDYNRIIANLVDALNVMGYVDRAGGGGGGHADDRALRHFANGLGMEKLELVREVVVEDETLLMEIGGESTALAGVSMVMWQPGHWSAIASNVSPSCKYVDDRFFLSLTLTRYLGCSARKK